MSAMNLVQLDELQTNNSCASMKLHVRLQISGYINQKISILVKKLLQRVQLVPQKLQPGAN